MLTSTILVQEPDYIGFRKVELPLRAEGVVYDGADPYATPLGVIFLVDVAGEKRPQEIYVPRDCRLEGNDVIYRHDLNFARYVAGRNGFEQNQLQLGDTSPTESAREVLRAFFETINKCSASTRYRMEVHG